MKRDQIFWAAARVFIGFVFAYAGFSKLIEPIENFRGAIVEYDVFPYAWVNVIAHVTPWMELIFGAFLCLGYAPRWSAAGVCLLSLGLIITLASSNVLIHSGSKVCGCFGQNSLIRLTVRQMFVFDIFSFLITLKLSNKKSFPWSVHSLLKG